jgi:hypothetical protein
MCTLLSPWLLTSDGKYPETGFKNFSYDLGYGGMSHHKDGAG